MKFDLRIFLAQTPFARLIITLIAGILLQWYFGPPVSISLALFCATVVFISMSFFLNVKLTYRLRLLRGILITVALITLGMLITFTKNTTKQKNWFGNFYKNGDTLIATITEPLIEKANSFKSESIISYIISQGKIRRASGRINIYFKKDSSLAIKYGDRVMFRRPLQEIKNTGNPGSFDYKRYALFNKITHTAYLTEKDFVIVKSPPVKDWQWFVFSLRAKILNIIRTYIPQDKEQGLAEALLIGYKDDLDKSLLRSYSNTGVVHVIAVSGMHLALIYWILDILLRPLLKRKATRWLHPVIVLGVLWLFTFLTGLAPSIVRAAVMFSFILLGKSINRNASIYNTLAASAFLLLCYNPFWLWDVGFQLSYIAVLSIVIFYKPIYNLIFVKNKIVNSIWELVAVTLAAQVLTTPLVIYYFHQFPVYFLLTNLIAVPLSSVILIGEIILIIVTPIKIIAAFLGKALYHGIYFLNAYIGLNEKLPFALWNGLQVNITQVILLYIFIAAISAWLLYNLRNGMWLALGSLLIFAGLRVHSFYKSAGQQELIVYNDSKRTAIEFINGRSAAFMGDSSMLDEDSSSYPVLKPSHILHRIKHKSTANFMVSGNAAIFHNKKFIWLSSAVNQAAGEVSDSVDYLILSGNPRLYMNRVVNIIRPKYVVITASVPAYKAVYWKKDCDSLKIPYHDIKEQGAFVKSF